MTPVNQNPIQYFHGMNPRADAVMNGYNYPHCPDFVDVCYYPAGTLPTSGTQLVIDIDMDADFVWRGVILPSGGSDNVRFSDSQGYYLSNDFIAATLIGNDLTQPFPIFPEIIIPRGGKVTVFTEDPVSGPLSVLLIGAKRYYLGGGGRS